MNRIAHRLIFALAAAAVLVPAVVFAQLPPVAQQHLAAATASLDSIDAKAVSVEVGNQVAALRRDFEEMQAALQSRTTSAETDWRTKYSAVERDLGGLIGPVNARSDEAANLPPLDASTRGALQQFRSNIQLFYAATIGPSTQASPTAPTNPASAPTMPNAGAAAPAAPPSAPTAAGTTGTSIPREAAAAQPPSTPNQPAIDAEGASGLLDRMETVLSAALGGKSAANGKPVGTGGVLPGVDSKSKAGKLTVDRAALDEILAEVQQLKTMLRVKP